MLVLSRKRDEVIIIETSEGPIEITICSHHSRPVKLGIEAPQSMRIHRKEVYERIQQEKQTT